MKRFQQLTDFRSYRRSLDPSTKVGFVPTMGALHAGHGSLLKASSEQNDVTVLSIYVNQTQFNNPADLAKYPNQLEADLTVAESSGVDAVLLPDFAQMYPDDFRYRLDETDFSRSLCGAHRPGHFTGVLTVVLKLLNIVQPDYAYFGEKDCQQLRLIQGMAEAFFLDVEIIGVPTVREPDGLAMSSRNLNLTPEQRDRAPRLNQILTSESDDCQAIAKLEENGFEVDYLETIGNRRFVAATLGAVRLIDNVAVLQ